MNGNWSTSDYFIFSDALTYSDPENNTSARLFDGPTYFIPILPQPPKLRLALRHLLPEDQIPPGVDPNITESFGIEYKEREFKDAIVLMNRRKRLRDEEASQESDISGSASKKVRRGGRHGGSGQGGSKQRSRWAWWYVDIPSFVLLTSIFS